MVAALEAVTASELTISAAASRFSVPRKTLDDRVKGRVKHGSKSGVSTVLTPTEEEALESYLIYMANRGFPLTRTMVKAFAWSIAKRLGKSGQFNSEYGPGEKWWTLFKQRHPQLSLRRSDPLDRNRAEALNSSIVNEYYDLLHTVLTDNNILNNARQILNCDETFVPLDYSREKVVTTKGAKNVYRQSQGTSEHITMLCCASAAGFPLPPLIIFSKCFPGGQYRFDGPDDALYAKSESGWIDVELFITWFKKIFLKFAVPQRPLLLLIDGHKSHMGLELVDLCRENNVILFCLPPHTTHALQPLDVSVFKSLKDHFSKSVRSLTFAKKNFVVSKRDFSRIIKSPFERAFSIPNIKAGFAKCGLCPFNRNAVPIMKMMPSSLHDTSNIDSSSDSATPCSSLQVTGNSNSVSPVPSSETYSVSSVSTTGVNSTPTSSTCTCSALGNTLSNISTPVSRPIDNPLVSARLIPAEMADILETPLPDAASIRKRTKHITGARDLTAEDYREMLVQNKRRKEELEQQKQKRIEEREGKKQEKDKKKEESVKHKGNKAAGKGNKAAGKGKEKRRQVQRRPSDQSSASDDDCVFRIGTSATNDAQFSSGHSSRPRRQPQLPSRFRSESDGENDGSICTVCGRNEPEGLGAEIIFWIDCSVCGEWAHNVCVFGSNTVTRQYVCKNC